MYTGDQEEEERYWSSEDEEEGDEAPGGGSHAHRIYNTKYGSKQLVTMDTILAKNIVSMSGGKGLKDQSFGQLGLKCLDHLSRAGNQVGTGEGGPRPN